MDDTLMCHKRQLGRKHKLQRCNRIANHGERCKLVEHSRLRDTLRIKMAVRAPKRRHDWKRRKNTESTADPEARSATGTRTKLNLATLRRRYTSPGDDSASHTPTQTKTEPRANTKHSCKPQTSDLPQAPPQAPPHPAQVDTPPSKQN